MLYRFLWEVPKVGVRQVELVEVPEGEDPWCVFAKWVHQFQPLMNVIEVKLPEGARKGVLRGLMGDYEHWFVPIPEGEVLEGQVCYFDDDGEVVHFYYTAGEVAGGPPAIQLYKVLRPAEVG